MQHMRLWVGLLGWLAVAYLPAVFGMRFSSGQWHDLLENRPGVRRPESSRAWLVWRNERPLGDRMNGRRSRALLAAFFIIAGLLHFIFPAAYIGIMPPWLPWHPALVFVSGVCEMAGGLGVLFGTTRRAAGVGLILLSIAVLPANLQMLLDARATGEAVWWQALLLLRLPLQLLLIFWIWRTTRRDSVFGRSSSAGA